jgi:hypothetical protein
MASLNLPRMHRWGNRNVPCQVPADHRRPIGEVCQLAWSSPCFPRLLPYDVPSACRFLVRPQLLTRP